MNPPPRPWLWWKTLLLWFFAKSLLLLVWWWFDTGAKGDVLYYWESLTALPDLGPQGVLVEYPTPMLWTLALPFMLGAQGTWGYVFTFAALMLLVDLGLTMALQRAWRQRRGATIPWPALFWIALATAAGPISFLRFDMLTASLAALALLLLAERRPGWAGVLLAVGASLKLWPALLFPALLARRGHRLPASLGFALTGVGLAGASLVHAGWDRLISPLQYQADRGLQVESIPATVPMLHRLISPAQFQVGVSRFHAYEISGPFTDVWAGVASALTVLGFGVIATLVIMHLRSSRGRTPATAGAVMLAITCVMVMSNKTFSPQYLLWIGGLVAAILAVSAQVPHSPARRRVAGATLAIVALTVPVYPIAYGLLVDEYTAITWPLTILLAVRNATVVWLSVEVIRWLVQHYRQPAAETR